MDGILQAGRRSMHVLKCREVEPRAPSSFMGVISPTGSSKETESRTLLPLRLIDVNSTLNDQGGRVCFVTPENMEFHVISHTWSQDIRDLSRRIGSTLAANDHRGDAYTAASMHLDLSTEAGFVALKEFLGLLSSDGVERVWMDALCINQCDDNEKSREICSMAAFYRFSKGCYVSTHGLGQGFNLWSSVNEEQVVGWIPRWFQRAWTFQELLLPQTLHFIVDGLSGSTIANLNKGIVNAGKCGFCICCIRKSPGFVMRTFADALTVLDCTFCGTECHDIEFPSENDIIMENEEHQVCSECSQPDLIRKARVKNRADTYFVERIAYFFVMQSSLGTEILLHLPYCEYPAVDDECFRKMVEVLNIACRSDCKAEFKLLLERFDRQFMQWFHLQNEEYPKCSMFLRERTTPKNEEYPKWLMFLRESTTPSRISGRISDVHSLTDCFEIILKECIEKILQEFKREECDFNQNMLLLGKIKSNLIISDRALGKTVEKYGEANSNRDDLQEISESLFGIALNLMNRRDERSFYLFVGILEKCALEGSLQDARERLEGSFVAQGIRKLRNLYSLLTKAVDSRSSPSRIELWQVALEIRNRDCSVEEDRILSILGLIPEMQALKQVRTGKPLNSQLVHVARMCSDKTVFEMCLMDKTNDIPGMSWAPKLTPEMNLAIDSDDEFAEVNYSRVGRIQEVAEGAWVENVEPHGISIKCGVIYGQLHLTGNILQGAEYGELRLCNGNLELLIPLKCQLKNFSTVIKFPKKFSCTIPIPRGASSEYEVMFLIVGKSDEKHLISMMCVAYQTIDDIKALHKVGVVTLLEDDYKVLIQPNTGCCVGGVGDYEKKLLDQDVKKISMEILKEANELKEKIMESVQEAFEWKNIMEIIQEANEFMKKGMEIIQETNEFMKKGMEIIQEANEFRKKRMEIIQDENEFKKKRMEMVQENNGDYTRSKQLQEEKKGDYARNEFKKKIMEIIREVNEFVKRRMEIIQEANEFEKRRMEIIQEANEFEMKIMEIMQEANKLINRREKITLVIRLYSFRCSEGYLEEKIGDYPRTDFEKKIMEITKETFQFKKRCREIVQEECKFLKESFRNIHGADEFLQRWNYKVVEAEEFEKKTKEIIQEAREFEKKIMEIIQEANKFEKKTMEIIQEAKEFEKKTMEIIQEANEFEKKTMEIIQEANEFEKKTMEIIQEANEFEKKTMEIIQEAKEFEKKTMEIIQEENELKKRWDDNI